MSTTTFPNGIWCAAAANGHYVLGTGDTEIASGLSETHAKAIVEIVRTAPAQLSEVDETCTRSKLDLDSGCDLFISAYSECNADHAPTVARVRMTRALLKFMEDKMRTVVKEGLLSVKTARFPGVETISSDDEMCFDWTIVIDDESFRLTPDTGGPGIATQSVFLENLLASIADGPNSAEFAWHAGALMMCNQDLKGLAYRAEEAFPDFKAEVTRRRMDATIAASAPVSVANTSRRRPQI